MRRRRGRARPLAGLDGAPRAWYAVAKVLCRVWCPAGYAAAARVAGRGAVALSHGGIIPRHTMGLQYLRAFVNSLFTFEVIPPPLPPSVPLPAVPAAAGSGAADLCHLLPSVPAAAGAAACRGGRGAVGDRGAACSCQSIRPEDTLVS